MKTITLEMPEDATDLDWCSGEEFPGQLRLAAAIFWYDRGLISQGKGGEIAGLKRAGFIRAPSKLCRLRDGIAFPLRLLARCMNRWQRRLLLLE